MHDMDAVYTDEYRKGYWDRNFPIPIDPELERARKFKNPGEDGETVNVSEFLMHLDDRVVRPELDRRYKVLPGKERLPRMAMFKALVWRKIIGEASLRAFHRRLLDSPFEALELGFRYERETNRVLVPSYQALWHFANVRFDVEELDGLLDALVRENAKLGSDLDLSIGERTATDATPLETCRDDAAGVWNGHYKKRMVKVEITQDVGTWLILAWKVIGGTDGEGEHLIEMLGKAKERVGQGVMKETFFDGGFTSNENLAKVAVLLKLRARYKISEGWVGNVRYPRDGPGERSPAEEVERLYEERWKESWYRPGASLEYKMLCLVQAGEYETVAMHFRNAYIARHEEDPDGALDEYHVRNNIEGENGHLKVHYSLESALNVVGERAIKRHVLWTMIATHVVAMVRLQHGVKGNLLSTTHIM
ncbi:MAG: transposase [Patescibacteria group bacterium]